ncbi:hypothetical protein SAMN05216577_13674 [Pseudomonas citronellolis]|uniref:Uncharacterized protein n=1 Tax=Pseudomonas citronellolis TaxID=53408 RepID=A0AAQ1KM36_9PSED|nr:hypothetical protein SAMN05216577_13674 [Pseudomonas citronellolis]
MSPTPVGVVVYRLYRGALRRSELAREPRFQVDAKRADNAERPPLPLAGEGWGEGAESTRNPADAGKHRSRARTKRLLRKAELMRRRRAHNAPSVICRRLRHQGHRRVTANGYPPYVFRFPSAGLRRPRNADNKKGAPKGAFSVPS